MDFAVRHLTKAYGRVTVLRDVDLAVGEGEIHALLGANGAGKSTLIKCVSGAVEPTSGEIELAGRTYTALSPKEAREAGVRVIHQDLALAPTLTVADNVFLGDELGRGPFVRRGAQRKEAMEWLGRLGTEISPRAVLASLDQAQQQSVAIAKALRSKPGVLILDEPTAALTDAEALRLCAQLKLLRQHGTPILYVTHRLSEVFDLADRITILRGGEVVLSGRVDRLSAGEIVRAIAGRSLTRERASDRPPATCGDPALLEARGIVSPGLGPVDFDLAPGEILGVFGLVGAGRTELVEALFAARRVVAGEIRIAGRPVTPRSPRDAVACGVALVPSDRQRKSVFATRSASDNVLLPSLRRIGRLGLRRPQTEARAIAEVAERLNLQPRRGDLEARRFSGGNQQKLVIGRWLHRGVRCRVLLLDEPTQGVDVGARSDLYAALRSFATGDRAVIATSSEPEELIQLAHRVLVLSHGRVAGVLTGPDLTEERMLQLAHLGDG